MALPSSIDDETLYRVKVKKAIALDPHDNVVLAPQSENVVKGRVLKVLNEADVESAEPF
jgi:hypothetical protein